MTVANIDQKIAVQETGLAVGWLPEARVRDQLANGRLIALKVHEPRQAIQLHLARHAEDQGKALMWFWEKLGDSPDIAAWLQP